MTNLDSFNERNDLIDFWMRYKGNSPKKARELFPDRPIGYVKTSRILANYAANKATAMECRLRGSVDVALHYEGICESIYKTLPEWARW